MGSPVRSEDEVDLSQIDIDGQFAKERLPIHAARTEADLLSSVVSGPRVIGYRVLGHSRRDLAAIAAREAAHL